MSGVISHQGIVEQVSGTTIKVRIINLSACATCHAKGACTAADSKEKIIEISKQHHNSKPGDVVTVVLDQSKGYKALLFGYILPFILVMTVLIIAVVSGISEILSATMSIISLLPYYIVLYLFRDKLKKTFQFKILT